MKRVRLSIILLIILFVLPYAFAYIDPGTGGYLISSLWAYLVAFISVMFGIVAHFFRHTLRLWIMQLQHKYPTVFLIASIFLILGLVSFFSWIISLYNIPTDADFQLNAYDESLNGVQIYDKAQVYEGYTLLEGKLINMTGEVVQSWPYIYLSYISSDGYYYAQKGYETLEWGKFYMNGTMIWSVDTPIHHEITEDSDGNIVVLGKEMQIYNGRKVEFDTVLTYSPDGVLLKTWSTWDALSQLKQFHRELELDKPAGSKLPDNHEKNISIWGADHDYYHMNSIAFVPPNRLANIHPAFTPGNWIVSFRHGSMVFILDKETQEVLWTGIDNQIPGSIEGQHAAQMDENGHVIIFDNGRYRGTSRIITVDAVNMEIVDEYAPDDFFTYSQGFIQRLPNDNWLVTESEKGRVFELNKEREIVWDYYYPFSIDDPDDGLVRDDIYRAYRYDADFIETYLI